MRHLNIIAFLIISNLVHAQKVTYDSIYKLANYNFVLGTQGIGGYYKFSSESALVEQAKHIRAMGSNILKISLGKNALKTYGLEKKKAASTLEFFQNTKDFKQVFDMDFKYIFSWVHTLTDVKWKNRFNKEDEKKIYKEMFDFASYLLKEYDSSGKIFFIGNWEGDWLLHANYNRNMTPPKSHVKNMTKWFNIRQKAIDDAKKKTKHENVQIYHYIELNLALKGIKGETSIAHSILPKVDVDFISYSSYEAIKNKTYQEKKETLSAIFNYLEKQLKPKDDLPFNRRVFIGEYGYQANLKKPITFDKQFKETKEIMRISLELNLPFALHWEMYNNEYDKKGNSKEMSLINEQGEKRPLYYLHKNYYKALNTYLKGYKLKYNTYPKSAEFNKKAIEVLNAL
jgi:hypothetical protein